MRQTKFRYILLPLLLLLASVTVFAQANSEVTGIVTDQSGAVVPGASITISDPTNGTVKTTVSGATGLYSIPGLNPSSYNLKVTATGFQAYEQRSLTVNVSSTVRVDIKMTLGSATETVTVEANALTVQADSNVVSSLISSEQISQIATENRNFAALAALGLGVSSAVPDSNTPTSIAANFTISVNGLRQSHNIWLIDGGEADDRGSGGGMSIMPSQDAIAEFNMLTSNYPPDYGISSGATMSLSLKSGTNKFHGTLWEFNRNTVYNANNFFNKYKTTTPAKRQVLNYNIYGFNIGGPLYIPGFYNTSKSKTFFFWNEEWRKMNQGSTPNVVNALDPADVPTWGEDLVYKKPAFAPANGGIVVPNVAGAQNAYFGPCLAASVTNKDQCQADLLTTYGLTPGEPFPNDTIPSALFDHNGVRYLNAGILPTATRSDGKIASQAQTPIKVRDDIVRIDHNINQKWAILGHYIHDSVTQANGGPELGWTWFSYNTVTSTLLNPSNSAAIKLSGTINPNLLVEASVNYDGNTIDITNSANSKLSANSAMSGWDVSPFFTLDGILQGKVQGVDSIPNVNGFGNPYGTAEDMGNAPWHNAAQDYMPKADISYTRGKHAMKFGVSYNRYTKNQQVNGATNGQFAFTGHAKGQFTGNLAACGGTSQPSCDSPGFYQGDGVMDMLLGMASGYQQQASAPINHYVNQTPSAYVNDNWHITPRLTLQLGLRYDALPHAWERNNNLANFDPNSFLSSSSPYWLSNGSMDPTGPGFLNYTIAGITSKYYTNGIRIAGQGGFPVGLVNNDYGTLQPRMGFSADLSGNGKTILRGGFGTFFERIQGNDIYDAAPNTPFVNQPSAGAVNMSDPHISTQTGLAAATPSFASGMTTLALKYPAPAVAQYSLGVQREVAPSLIWVVQYVGNLAWHQFGRRQFNNFPLDTPLQVRSHGGNVTTADGTSGGTPLPTEGQGHIANISDSWRTYGGYTTIVQQENTETGTYNGFQTGLRVQNRWGLSGELDYTWSHEIDIQTYDNTCCVGNPWYLKYDKGSGTLDRRHMVSANYIYNLPILRNSTGLTKSILGGWQIAGTVTVQTGVPVPTTLGGNDTIGLGGGYTNRPNVSGKMKYTKKVNTTTNQWFDTSLFSSPTAAWDGGPNQGFGSAGKDAVVGPGRVNFTTSLYKSFAITERAHFEMRFESFNTFNHTQFNSLNTSGPTSQNASFGQVTNTWDPRNLELAGKFVF